MLASQDLRPGHACALAAPPPASICAGLRDRQADLDMFGSVMLSSTVGLSPVQEDRGMLFLFGQQQWSPRYWNISHHGQWQIERALEVLRLPCPAHHAHVLGVIEGCEVPGRRWLWDECHLFNRRAARPLDYCSRARLSPRRSSSWRSRSATSPVFYGFDIYGRLVEVAHTCRDCSAHRERSRDPIYQEDERLRSHDVGADPTAAHSRRDRASLAARCQPIRRRRNGFQQPRSLRRISCRSPPWPSCGRAVPRGSGIRPLGVGAQPGRASQRRR